MAKFNEWLDRITAHPLKAFAWVAGTLSLLVVLARLAAGMPFSEWPVRVFEFPVAVGGLVAAAVWIKRRAGWMNWGWAWLATVQATVALVVFGIWISYFPSSAQFPNWLFGAILGFVALIAVELIIRNHWSGFLIEFLLGLGITVLFLGFEPESRTWGWRWKYELSVDGVRNVLFAFGWLALLSNVLSELEVRIRMRRPRRPPTLRTHSDELQV